MQIQLDAVNGHFTHSGMVSYRVISIFKFVPQFRIFCVMFSKEILINFSENINCTVFRNILEDSNDL